MSGTSSTISFSCDCGHFIQVPNRYAGRTIKCPRCGAKQQAVEDNSAARQVQNAPQPSDTANASTRTGRSQPVRILDPHRPKIGTTLELFALFMIGIAFLVAIVVFALEGPPAVAGIIFISLLASGISLLAWASIINATHATAYYTKVIAQLIAQQNE